MHSINFVEFRKLIIITILFGTIPIIEIQADENIESYIGLKSEAVVRNDLKQIGLPVSDITLIGTMAKVRVPIKGEKANIEVDDQTGAVRITIRGEVANIYVDRETGTIQKIEGSPIGRQFIESLFHNYSTLKDYPT